MLTHHNDESGRIAEKSVECIASAAAASASAPAVAANVFPAKSIEPRARTNLHVSRWSHAGHQCVRRWRQSDKRCDDNGSRSCAIGESWRWFGGNTNVYRIGRSSIEIGHERPSAGIITRPNIRRNCTNATAFRPQSSRLEDWFHIAAGSQGRTDQPWRGHVGHIASRPLTSSITIRIDLHTASHRNTAMVEASHTR